MHYFHCEKCGSRHSDTLACPYCTSIKEYTRLRARRDQFINRPFNAVDEKYMKRALQVTEDHLNHKPAPRLRLVSSNGVTK